MTEQEARKEAWRIAKADLEEANYFYDIPEDDAYEIEPLASDYPNVREAIEDLAYSFQYMKPMTPGTMALKLEDAIFEAVSDIKDELARQEQLREEYPELYEEL